MTDTHFHFEHTFAQDMAAGAACLEEMTKDGTFFGLDIGTRYNDLQSRASFLRKTLDAVEDLSIKEKAKSFLHFSAGIWPDPDSIVNRFEYMELLRKEIEAFEKDDFWKGKLVAIGEGGVDHHWNVANADHRDEKSFTPEMFEWEKDLFVMQLELAKEKDLPFIIHSRDGFDETIECVDRTGWHKGILHCCSYPLEKVIPFVDRGWYVSFSGSVTYTKKKAMEEMEALLRYVPDDRILLETDSPYLAPVPLRGNPNNPGNIVHTYDFIASKRGITVHKLQEKVNENVKRLFFE